MVVHHEIYIVLSTVLQRLGTTFLPAWVASWQYKRGRRSLEDTLSSPSTVPQQSGGCELVKQAATSAAGQLHTPEMENEDVSS